MIQKNQIGKYKKKQSIYDAKQGKIFVTPQNREYKFGYRIEGRKYIITLTYKGQNIQLSESDYNTINTDTILLAIENEL